MGFTIEAKRLLHRRVSEGLTCAALDASLLIDPNRLAIRYLYQYFFFFVEVVCHHQRSQLVDDLVDLVLNGLRRLRRRNVYVCK
jgi:hypothetical protein